MSEPTVLRFGAFELDSAAGELRQHGDLVRLPPQPLKVLDFLVRRSGQIVTRSDIRDHIWAGDTFVDFEQGLNFCIRQVREALGDAAGTPRFIETLPRRGYRFLAPVTPVRTPTPTPPDRITRLIVLPFRILRADADTDFLAFSLPDAIAASLSGLSPIVVRSTMAAARFGAEADPQTVATQADIDVIVTGTLLRAADAVRVTAQLTDAATGTLLWTYTTQTAVGDVFGVQDDLTQRIVASLALPLSGREQQQIQRDVPSSAAAYVHFLRGNQLSYDPKQWSVARDLYLRCVEDDPGFAPAWARLGRIHHVMAKYLESGTAEGLQRAEAAFRQALEVNPDLPSAHKLYAQLEVDLGRAPDAMARLLERAQCPDPELLSGLVSTCRYCGLLDASVAAHARAIGLEPRIRTSVPHTWFMQGDYARVVTSPVQESPYIVALSLAEVGRGAEALSVLRELEGLTTTRLRDFIVAARTLLEGRTAASVAAVNRVLASNFADPEGLFYLARHLAHLNESDRALALLERVVAGGFFCVPMMQRDPWLRPLRKKPAFTRVVRGAETGHLRAADSFTRLQGERRLGVAAGRLAD